MFKFFQCFSAPQEVIEEINEKPLYDSGLDGENYENKQQLYILIRDMIDYDKQDEQGNDNLGARIEKFRDFLADNLKKGILPMFFQQTYNIMEKQKLEKIIYEDIHNSNINLLLGLFEDIEEEDSVEDIDEEYIEE